jgi:hypothetical protein
VGKDHLIVKGWEDNSFTENWTYIEELSTRGANFNFTSNGDILTLNVSGNAKITFQYNALPLINTTEYPYVACRVKGSSNARWLFRLISQDGKIGYDFPYWETPSDNWTVYAFNIADTPLKNNVLDRRIYLGMQSIDSNRATLYIDFYMMFKYEPTQ